MNIILLSGGSGKRLWPLSNEIRSKQFIKLFKNENGEYESMLQRVYRQITTLDKDANITIATSKSQVSAIYNQLGDKVDVCVEPCRKDTFPAIALAASYLYDVSGLSNDEYVVVCPVDPFVDHTYYESVYKLVELASEGNANLTLMGISPTYPSEKYGYIIPETSEIISYVKEFKEKPDVKKATEYISKSALWNAGVFAFRLGYLLEKSHDLINFIDYYDLLSKYSELTPISFDYAVVEKEKSVQVMRYYGDWKDVGTWNTLSEAMSDLTKGNIILDDTCDNTHVINELDIPVLCMGCKNMIIAISSDGILVSEREQSAYMKSYVEEIDRDVMFAEKSWGTYTVIDVQPDSMTVKIALQSGSQMTYHSHELRNEVWTIASGEGKVIVEGTERYVSSGDVVSIPAGCKHILIAETDMNVIEVQIGESISAKDKKVFSLKKKIGAKELKY